MTNIYLIRHSKTLDNINNEYKNQELPLSDLGKKRAYNLSNNLPKIDYLYSSEYERAISTAKYISDKNNIDINITSKLNERKLGDVNSVPKSFWLTQLYEIDAKASFGESRREVMNRMLDVISYVLVNHKDKNVALVSHGAAITFFLMNYCELEYASLENKSRHLVYNNKTIINGTFDFPMVFKLEYNDKTIKNIKLVMNGELYEE